MNILKVGNKMITVLVTSVGGGVGQSILDSLSFYPETYKIVGLDIEEYVYASSQCDSFVQAPRIAEPNYIDFLLESCILYGVDILIPGNDMELLLLSEKKYLFSDVGVEVIVSPSRIIELSRDKFEWFCEFGDILPIVPTCRATDYLNDPSSFNDIVYPLIAKPAGGSASENVYIAHSLDDLKALDLRDHILQSYLFPCENDRDYEAIKRSVEKGVLIQKSELSLQLVFDSNSNLKGYFASINRLKSGVPVDIEIVNNALISDIVNKVVIVLSRESVIGPVNLQGRITDQGIYFFEMNLRFTGITGNRAFLGFNEVKYIVDHFTHSPAILGDPSLVSSRAGRRQYSCRAIPIDVTKNTKTILIVGGTSWAARNFISSCAKSEPLSNINWVISSRDLNKCQSYYLDMLSDDVFSNIIFINSDYNSLLSVMPQIDVLINFAFPLATAEPKEFFEALELTNDIVDILKIVCVNKVINISSQSVYPRGRELPLNENVSPCPETLYSLSKLNQEFSFKSVRRFNNSSHILNLRIGRLIGGRTSIPKSQLPFKLLDYMLGSCSSENSFTILASNGISFLDVDHFCGFLQSVITDDKSKFSSGEDSIFNLASYNTNMNQFYTAVKNAIVMKGLSYREPIICNDSPSDYLWIDYSKASEYYENLMVLDETVINSIDLYLSGDIE